MRRATDAGEPTNRELLDYIQRIDRTLERFTVEHRAEHRALDSCVNELQRDAIIREERVAAIAREMPELDALHDFRIQVQTLTKTAQWIFGGSLLAAVAAIVSLVLSIAHYLGDMP
jgi:GTP1/Obg family GTP-binding protein